MPQLSGLKLGIIALLVVGAIFSGIFAFGPGRSVDEQPETGLKPRLDFAAVFPDAASRNVIHALEGANPEAAETLRRELAFAQRDGTDQSDLSNILLQALFAQLGEQAIYVQRAETEDLDAIVSGFITGADQLAAAQSDWCAGPTLAGFLTENDDELVPSLLAKFPYGSPQYAWAMGWMTIVLNRAEKAQNFPYRHGRPTGRDEYILQQEGRALASSQWALALQIAGFANAEGQSYQAMQDAISAIDVCELGLAIEMVSERLPEDVRGRIWADLMPEIMVGNTPYALARVQDYFFIG